MEQQGDLATARTIATEGTIENGGEGVPNPTRTFARTTVLPRREVAEAERYEPVRTLGAGGMGEVLLVHDHDIGRKVAVKRLLPDQRDEAAVLRFAEEVRTVGHLEHPGIVPVHDVGVDDQGHHYLVMKYVEGDTLDVIIDKLKNGDPVATKRFTFEHRIAIFHSLLQALQYAHEKGVIHRDLKPSNVMVGAYGEVMLMDWGIAKKIERGVADPESVALADTHDPKAGPQRLIETMQGALLGTPLYMSPEQAKGKVSELDERSDIYSASLLLLELLLLEHPFADKKTVQEILIAQATQPLGAENTRERAMAVNAPAEWIWFVSKGLEKDPRDRFQTVAEMEERLRVIQSGKIAVKCHITFTKRATQEFLHWIDRNQNLYTLLFMLMVIAAVGALGIGVYALIRRF